MGVISHRTAKSRYLKGTDVVLRNLQRELARIRTGGVAGLLEAVAFIHAETEAVPPITPVKTGFLRNSWNVRSWWAGLRFFVRFGYSANYALYVHELLDQDVAKGQVNWTRSGSGAKWFEYAIKRNLPRIREIIFRNTKLK